jgi:hypothetical protein
MLRGSCYDYTAKGIKNGGKEGIELGEWARYGKIAK